MRSKIDFQVEPFEFTGESEDERRGTNRRYANNVRRLQSYLNQKLGLILPLNGLLDVNTRSALRSLLRQNGQRKRYGMGIGLSGEQEFGGTPVDVPTCVNRCW